MAKKEATKPMTKAQLKKEINVEIEAASQILVDLVDNIAVLVNEFVKGQAKK